MLLAAILASGMGFIDGSVVAIAIPAIRSDLAASLADAQWISNAYLLLLSALLMLGGASGDRFGVRNVFAAGIGLFTLASVACALAPGVGTLIAARTAQGLAAAFMIPASLALIAKAYPRNSRGRAIGIWASASALTTTLGPVLGGFLLTAFGDWSWRLVFAINLPLGAWALTLLLARVPADVAAGGRRLDLVGGVLVTLALLFLAYGLTGDAGGPPRRSRMVTFGGTGLVLLVLFLYWEARTAAPMLPLRLFARPAFSGAQLLTFALYFALSGLMFYLPMAMIGGWGEAPATVSLVLTPLGIAITLLSTPAGRLADHYGPAPVIGGGALVVAAALVLLGSTAPLMNAWLVVLPLMTVFGIGMGLVVSPLSTALMGSVEDRDSGVASGSNNAIARVAGLFAVATLGGVVASVFQRELGSAAELHLFFGLPVAEALTADLEALRLAATNAALAAVCYLCAALALLAAAVAWFTLGRGSGGAGGAVTE